MNLWFYLTSSEGASDQEEETPRTNRSTNNKKRRVKNGRNHVDMTPPEKLLKKAEKKADRYFSEKKVSVLINAGEQAFCLQINQYNRNVSTTQILWNMCLPCYRQCYFKSNVLLFLIILGSTSLFNKLNIAESPFGYLSIQCWKNVALPT